jgi:parvulin-like peptidyl-prolyl isomerase
MLKKMRGMARPIIWVVVIVFIAGMGTMGIGKIFQAKPYVGVIAGKKIRYEEYYKMLQNSYSNYVQNSEDKEVNGETERQLNDQTWDQLVQKIIYDNAIKKYGIKVSAKEVANRMLNKPLDMIKQHESFQTDGKFDIEKYHSALQNPNIDWSWLENYYYQIAPYEKLMNIIQSSAIVSDVEVKKDYLEKNTKVKADVIVFSPDMVDSVEVSEMEVKNYYQAHKEDFKKEPQRKLKYVKIPLTPSPADIKAVKDRTNEIYQMVMDGEDFAELAKEYSDCPSASKGGDLGFFGKGRMDLTFEKQAFSMKKGEVSKPFKTRFGWHIVKLNDIRYTDGDKEVHASHILIKEEPGAETIRNLEKVASDFYERCANDSFQVAAKDIAYEIQETSEFNKDSRYLPGIGRAKTLIDFAFSHKLGSVSEPYQSESGDYFIATISYKVGKHYEDLYQVKDRISSEIEVNKKMELLAIKADSIAVDIYPNNFYKIAKRKNLKIVSTNLITKSSYIKDIGREERLNQAILDLKVESKISDLIKGKGGYYLAKLVEFQPADMKEFEKEKQELKSKMLTQKENQVYNGWYNKAKEDANIKDWRSRYFRM